MGLQELRMERALSALEFMERRIIDVVAERPRSSRQLARELRINWQTVQRHLNRLEELGHVRRVFVGKKQRWDVGVLRQ